MHPAQAAAVHLPLFLPSPFFSSLPNLASLTVLAKETAGERTEFTAHLKSHGEVEHLREGETGAGAEVVKGGAFGTGGLPEFEFFGREANGEAFGFGLDIVDERQPLKILEDMLRSGNEAGFTGAKERMVAGEAGPIGTTGESIKSTAKGFGLLDGDEGTAAGGRFHHEQALAKGSDDAVALGKGFGVGMTTKGIFADYEATGADDVTRQGFSAGGVNAVKRGSNHREGTPGSFGAGEKGTFMSGGIDSLGQTAEDVETGGSQAKGKTTGLLGTVNGGAAGTDNGDVTLGEEANVTGTIETEGRGGCGTQPLGIVGVGPRKDTHGASGGTSFLAQGGEGGSNFGGERGAKVFAPLGDGLGPGLGGGRKGTKGPFERTGLGRPHAWHAVEGDERVARVNHQRVCPTVMQMFPKISSAEQPRERSLMGLATPCTTGPRAVAPPRRCTSL